MSHWESERFWERLRRENPPAGHLNDCPACADRLIELKELESQLAGLRFLGAANCDDHIPADELANFIEYRHADRSRIKAHLQTCDRCFEDAAYYYSESIQMKAAAEEPTPEPLRRAAFAIVPRKSWLQRWVIAPMPAYAAAAIFWLVFSLTAPTPQVAITRDSPFYGIYEKQYNALPYFYFSGDGHRVGNEVSGMRITTTRGKALFRWNEVAGADDYYFVLQEIRDGAPRRIDEKFLKDTSIWIDSADLIPGSSYRWVVAGRLPENRYFQGTMEFNLSR